MERSETKKNGVVEENSLESILEKYNPSELDEAVKRLCSKFQLNERNYTSTYLNFHEYGKAGILTRLQLQLKNTEIIAEDELDTGRIDGSLDIGVENDDVFLYEGGEEAERIALIEVKTEELKPLQSAAYTFMEKTPTLVAEIKKGVCHQIDIETARKLLSYAKEQFDALTELDKNNQFIPDSFRCESCSNHSFDYWEKNNSGPETRFVVKERTNQLHENLSVVVAELIEIVKDLLEKRGFPVEE